MEKSEKKYLASLRDYQDVFNSDAGKRVLNDLMSKHWFMSSTMTTEPNEIFFREGERNVVLRIMNQLEIDILEVENRIKEASRERSNW